MQARGKAVGSLTGSAVDRVGALTGSGQNPGRPLTGSCQKFGSGVDRVRSKIWVGLYRVGPKIGRVLTDHDDVIMTSAPGNITGLTGSEIGWGGDWVGQVTGSS